MVICAVAELSSSASGQLTVQFESDGAYHVSVNKQLWLTSAPTFFYVNGVSHSTSDCSLKQTGEPRDISGKDALGQWNGQTVSYTADGAKVSVSLRTYDVVSGQLAIFTQVNVNDSPCSSPCMASPAGQTNQRGLGLSGTIHEEAHLGLP